MKRLRVPVVVHVAAGGGPPTAASLVQTMVATRRRSLRNFESLGSKKKNFGKTGQKSLSSNFFGGTDGFSEAHHDLYLYHLQSWS